jgi:5-methylcytosine-specific restriction endonuclease McrA
MKLEKSIDRIDNNKGYEIENVTSCCKRCNNAKGQSSVDEFLDWIKQISKNKIKGS